MPQERDRVAEALAPVEKDLGIAAEVQPTSGVGLCLSGGGYRAMVFHLGTLLRFNDLGLLPTLTRISSVSGGSITAGVLGLRWNALRFNVAGVAENFHEEVVQPVRRLAGVTIDVSSVLRGVLLPGTVSERIVDAYDKHLFGGATLQALPDDPPRFVINAVSVQSGALVRFMKIGVRDYRVGNFGAHDVRLATAVAASSAFPPVLSPTVVDLSDATSPPPHGVDLAVEPYTSRAVLSDGGVYDNLGLETIWKRCAVVLVSDAGGKLKPEPRPKRDWLRHTIRILETVDNQVRSLRKRQLIASFVTGQRRGAYWSVRTPISKYGLPDALPCPAEHSDELAATPTRLQRMQPRLQERLINWGYSVCDAALRAHYDTTLKPPVAFPFPDAGV